MIFEKHEDLLKRKKAIGWTNREIGNAMGVSPGVASSKLNGFIILTTAERERLIRAMDAFESQMSLNKNHRFLYNNKTLFQEV